MNIESVKTFLKLVETGSYTKAAQKMMLTQSAISKRIRDLEADLDCELVNHTQKTIQLTPSGRAFVDYAEQLIELETQIRNEIRPEGLGTEQFHIGTVDSLYEYHVAEIVCELLKRKKHIKTKVLVEGSGRLLNELMDGYLDCCFTYMRFTEKNYVCVPFRQDRMVLVTGDPNHPFQEGITDEELKQQDLIKDTLVYITDPKWFEQIFSGKEHQVHEIHHNYKSIPLIRSGLCMGFLPECRAKELCDKGELFEIRILEHAPLYLQSYLVYRKNNPFGEELNREYCGKQR